MSHDNRVNIIGIVLILIIGGFAAGWYSKPETKTVDDTKTEEKDKTKTEDHKKTTIVKDKDGNETTTIIDDSTTTSNHSKDSESKKETTVTSHSKINVSALAAIDTKSQPIPLYGISINKELIGPITVGAFGLTSGVVGISIGINF